MRETDSNIEQLLQEGIAAIKRGDRSRGRDLLLQVVEKDECIEMAWLWLSSVVEDPEDQIVALENALTINPANAAARKRLAQLKASAVAVSRPVPGWSASAGMPLAPEPPAHTASSEASVPPNSRRDLFRHIMVGTPQEADDGIDDPLQCAYCGKPTSEDDRKCPHCGKKLYWRVRKSDTSEYLQLVMVGLGLALATGIMESAGPLFRISISRGAYFGGYEILLRLFGVKAFLGNFMLLPEKIAPVLLSIYLGRSAIMAVLAIGLSRRWAAAYYGTMGLMLADLGFTLYLVLTGYLGLAGCALNFILATGILTLLAAAYPEFPVNEERLLTKPDGTARSALDYYRRGHFYRQKGMWALAVAQWRKAVGMAPKEPIYYKDLGIGYAQIGRFDRSLRALAEARHQAPHDSDLPHIIAVVQTEAERQRQADGQTANLNRSDRQAPS